MENNKIVIFWIILFTGGTLLVSPFFGYAYDDKTTHPALTQEIVKFFNQNYPEKTLGQDELELVVKGSIDEDKGIRWMHHFYDPVYNRGLLLEDVRYGNNLNLAVISAGAQSQWESAKTWAQSSSLQSGLAHSLFGGVFSNNFSDKDDYSWDRTIYEYAWGDKAYGLRALGHILHLLEDSSVPDHTRNDPHPNIHNFGSPYENWAKKFDRKTIEIDLKGQKLVALSSIDKYFNSIANYSNNNFFSQDTIFSKIYTSPKIFIEKSEIINGKKYLYGFGKDAENHEYHLVQVIKRFGDTEIEYVIDDKIEVILTDYWSLLSKQAVLHGAGAIKLFFDEVAKEKQSKTLYNKNRSWFAKKLAAFSGIVFGASKLFYGSSVSLEDLGDSANISPAPQPQNPLGGETAKINTPPSNSNRGDLLSNLLASFSHPPLPQNPPPETKNPPPPVAAIPPQSRNTSPSLPIAGAGGPSLAPAAQASTGVSSETNNFAPPPTPAPSTTPNIPLVTFPGSDNQTFTSPSLTFTGNADFNTAITTNFSSASTSVNSLGVWSLLLNPLPQGTTTIQFFAKNISGVLSSPASRTFFIDSEAPLVSLSISQCSQSLSPAGCLTAKNDITLAWSSNASDLAYYTITCTANGVPCSGFSSATTTATSTQYTLPSDNTSYIFSAKARDRYGNESNAATQTVSYYSKPVIINEIAWAGTGSSFAADEWIELHNSTSQTIDLSNIRLKSQSDAKPSLNLSGSIPPGGYYIIERTNDDTISGLTASSTASFGSGSGAGLSNSGEVLALEYGDTILDQTPAITDCGGWCGGNASGNYPTMERIDPAISGTNKTNWTSWIGFPQNGKAADGVTLVGGTPGKRNSVNHLIDPSLAALSANKTLTKAGSPYTIISDFVIPSGRTLTLEAGAVVKFYNGTSLTVEGTLASSGSAAEPAVFTSMHDDTYGDDLNANGTSTAPAHGDWKSIKINGAVTLNHTKVRYGGYKDFSASWWALINGENCSFTARNSTFEFSGVYGIWLRACTGTLENNTIQYNNKNNNGDSTGLIAYNSSYTVSGNTFRDNYLGANIYSSDGTPTLSITNNHFVENESYALSISNVYPTFSGNTASANGINGIFIAENTAVKTYTFTPDLPYILQSQTVPAGKTLAFNAGTIIKFAANAALSVYGTLKANGATANRVIFTSFADDSCGITGGCGDTNGTSTPLAIGDWNNIAFLSGSASSSLAYTTIRYGGGNSNFSPFGALRIENAPLTLDNIIVEHNRRGGIFMQNASSVSIANSLIQHHNETAGENDFGMFLSASSTPVISNTTFRQNETHIYNDATSAHIDGGGNVFE